MATRLFVKSNGSGRPRYKIWIDRDGAQREVRLAGFSFYGEVGGLLTRPPAKFVELMPDTDPPNENWRSALSHDASENIVMTYGQWMAFLAEHSISHSRIFCFPEVFCRQYPVFRYGPTAPADRRGRYDLTLRSGVYMARLTRYLELARRKGIVVQISFASIQMLRDNPGGGDWDANPFNFSAKPDMGGFRNNINGFIDEANGVGTFCKLGASPALAAAEKLVVDSVVNAAKPYWNVMFELFNEPNPNLGELQVANWFTTVANWVDAKIRDPRTNVRSHLVTINAPEELLSHTRSGGSILKPLLLDGAGRVRSSPLIDAYQFHGSLWGGDSGVSGMASRPQPALDRTTVREKTQEAIDAFYNRPIDAAGAHTVGEAPVAVICDSDAHYRAQDHPEMYGLVALNNGVSYIHRWSNVYLTQGKVKAQIAALKPVILTDFMPGPDPTPGPPPPPAPREDEDL
ncbi:MAG: hypothetical protein ABI779_11625 [Acidobacteriota bacterium]